MSDVVATSFVKSLFRPVQHSKIFITQLPYGNNALTDATNPRIHGDIRTGSWFFGVCPRDKNGAVIGVSVIWTDLDKVSVPPDNIFLAPPSVMVSSGHGIHLYHQLSSLLTVEDGLRLTKLSALAFNGDTAVCESSRIMRLPGSLNIKDSVQPRECTLVDDNGSLYTPEELQERLMAAVITPYWLSGQRHQVALSLGALLARAKWDLNRATNVITHLCDFTKDSEKLDRQFALKTSFGRWLSGDLVSSAFLREAMDKDFKRLLVALGITARDGELIYQDEVFGKVGTLEKNLVTLVINTITDWEWADGVPVKWVGTHWHHYDDDVLRKSIFDVFTNVKVIQSGDEVEFDPSIKTSSAVMQMFKGNCKINELGLPREDIVPVENGVIELPSMNFRPHEKGDFNRFVLPVVYDESQECPTLERFLLEGLGGAVDVYEYIQEFIGYCLMLGNPHQKMLWLQGQTGSGKSTFLGFIYGLFGKAAVPIEPNDLNEQVVAAICHSHIAVCSEISRRKLQTRRINELVTGDNLRARFLYGRQFDASFRGKILWASNSFPPIDEGEGFWRRLVTIPFNSQPKREDIMLWSKLKKERSGALNWALKGALRIEKYIAETGEWQVPTSAVELLRSYRESAEIMEQFKDDCIVTDPTGLMAIDETYVMYKTWVENRGHRPLPCDATWFNEMSRLGLKRAPEPVRTKVGPKRALIGGRFREFIFEGIKKNEE